MSTVKIGLMGLGNIGTGTFKALKKNKEIIKRNTGIDMEITKILEKDIDRDRGIIIDREMFTINPDDIFKDDEISVVIELLGGIEPATTLMLEAMKNKKHVVTANKAAVAANYDILVNTAKENNVEFKFEASVGGAIPILSAIQTGLQANDFDEVLGIVNGTTNYILTQMDEFGYEYEDVLKDAQAKGFAEVDPTADVEGIDVANKLSILMALLFDIRVHPEDIPREGITKITKADIEDARKKNAKIKLIAAAKKVDGKIEYSVKPTLMDNSHPLAGIKNEFNAIFITGHPVDELMFYGRGAGAAPTASAILGDVIEIIKTNK